MEWVVIKGISHYADVREPETKEWRQFSSVMAASVVNHILKEPDVLKDWPHYKVRIIFSSSGQESRNWLCHTRDAWTGKL